VVKDLNDFLAAGATQKRPWSGAVIFQTRIRRNVKLAESPGFGKTILQYDTASHGAADYRALAQEVIALQPVLGNTAGIAVPAPLRPAVERAVLPATNAVA
jgi:chromosome partitioning protein